jgi:hypothetical protein
LHVEFVPGIGEANREAEALINPTDGGTDFRVTMAAGAAPGISADLAALLAAVQARGTDTADSVRAVRSAVESLLYEMQHPKQVLYEGPDTAVPVGGVYLSPWIDTNMWRIIGYYWANTGQNVMTSLLTYWSEDPAGAAPFNPGSGGAAALAIGTCWYTQDGMIMNNGWINTRCAPLVARYLRLWASSALGTTGRCKIVGMR